jgi:hypothetical protein
MPVLPVHCDCTSQAQTLAVAPDLLPRVLRRRLCHPGAIHRNRPLGAAAHRVENVAKRPSDDYGSGKRGIVRNRTMRGRCTCSADGYTADLHVGLIKTAAVASG